MQDLPDATMSQYLRAVSRASPVWAGGSVAAVTTAQAWALIAMIAGLASRRDQSSTHWAPLLTRSRIAQERLLGLAAEDAQTFAAVLKSPQPHLYYQSCRVPLDIRDWALEGLTYLAQESLRSYRPAEVDAALAVHLLETVVQAIEEIIQANLPYLLPEAQSAVIDRLKSSGPP